MALTKASAGIIKTEELLNNRNIIINGDMRIAQRNTSSANVSTTGYRTIDRMEYHQQSSFLAKHTVQQIEDAPTETGLVYSSKVTVTATDTMASDEYAAHPYYVEGYDMQKLKFGTSAAKTFTLSFWVKSSIAGEYAVAFQNEGNSRNFMATYRINSANTWEQKSLVIPGCTDGIWSTTNGYGLKIWISLGTGSNYAANSTLTSWQSSLVLGSTNGVKLGETLNASWQITGLQMEIGTVATPFEHRPYATEILLCQRYYVKMGSESRISGLGSGVTTSTNSGWATIKHPVRMRTQPTIAINGAITLSHGSSYPTSPTLGSTYTNLDASMISISYTGQTPYSGAGQGTVLYTQDGAHDFISFNAEL